MIAVFDKNFYLEEEVKGKSKETLKKMAEYDVDYACLYGDDEYAAIVDSNENAFSECHIFKV